MAKKISAERKSPVQKPDIADADGRWRSIFENMKDTVMTVSRDCKILSCNHYQQGYTEKDVLGNSVFNFVTPAKLDYIKSGIKKLLASGHSFEVEDSIIGPDGSVAWYYSIYSPIKSKSGVINEFMIITRNTTLTKLAENMVLTAMFDGQEAERKRVSGELHDGLGQNIAAIRFNLLQLEEKHRQLNDGKMDKIINNIHHLIVKASDEVRAISRNLAPPRLEEFGLETAVRDFCEEVSSARSVKVSFKATNLSQRLLPALETTVYRITQELVNNVIKHASTDKCLVAIERKGKKLLLTVSDKGKGFNTLKPSKGLGLQNIQSRVKIHAGKVHLISHAGRGTRVIIEFPL